MACRDCYLTKLGHRVLVALRLIRGYSFQPTLADHSRTLYLAE